MAGGGELTLLREWVEARTGAAPPALRLRMLEFVAAAPATADAATVLAGAAQAALGHVLAHSGDRSVALDLLSADGLITLALLRQAEADPAALAAFARSLTGPDAGATVP